MLLRTPQDGSGSLDRGEVRKLIEMVGASVKDAELDEAMAALDPSGDGQVDFPEFKKYWVRTAACRFCRSAVSFFTICNKGTSRLSNAECVRARCRTRTLSRAAAC